MVADGERPLSKIIKFPDKRKKPASTLEEAGFELTLEPDHYLELSKGHVNQGVLIIGYETDDDMFMSSNIDDVGKLIWMIEKFKEFLIKDNYD